MTARRAHRLAAAVVVALALATTGCSSSGGKKAEEDAAGLSAGQANTPRMKIALVTHAVEGDTFWDIVKKGAETAARKDNAELLYSSNDQANKQAQLVQTAIDQDVDGIAVTLAKPDAMKAAIGRATKAGIPVVTLNAGEAESKQYGALSHFGQNEEKAGEEAGRQLTKMGAKNARCVIQEQGHVGLESRCAGAKKTFKGTLRNLYVQGANMPQVQSSIAAQLQSDDSIDTVLTLGAPFAMAALRSMDDASSDAKVATFDMDSEVVTALKDGEIEFAVDQQPYLQGYLSVDALWLEKNNGNVLGGGEAVLTGPEVITQSDAERVEKYAARGTR